MNQFLLKPLVACLCSLSLIALSGNAVAQNNESSNPLNLLKPVKGVDYSKVITRVMTSGLISEYAPKYPKIQETFRESRDWDLHNIAQNQDGDFNNSANVIMKGDVVIKGNYTSTDGGKLIVLGNLTANNIVSNGTIHVTGNLIIDGAVYANEVSNFTVEGNITSKVFINNKSNVKSKNIKTSVLIDQKNTDYASLYRYINPIVYAYDDIANYKLPVSLEEINLNRVPEFDVFAHYAGNFEDGVIRKEVAQANLFEEYKKAISNQTPSAELLRMVSLPKLDTLLAIALASRDDLPATSLQKILSNQDDAVLFALAENPNTSPELLVKISEVNSSGAGYAAQNDKLPLQKLNELVNNKDENYRYAATHSKKLNTIQLEKLATDKDEDTRLSALENYSGKLESRKIIQRNITHENTDIKLALLANNPYLTVEDYQILLEDESLDENKEPVIQMEVVNHLLQPSMYLAFKNTTQQQRVELLKNLSQNTENENILSLALVALDPSDQQAILKNKNSNTKNLFNQQLAFFTQDHNVMRQLLSSNQPEVLAELASNQSTPEKIQSALLENLPSISKVKSSAMPEVQFKTQFEIYKNLAFNRNIDPKIRTSVIEFCAGLEKSPSFCESTATIFNLAEQNINLLINAKDKKLKKEMLYNLYQQSFASEVAVKQKEFESVDLQNEFNSIKSLNGVAFWTALATAKSPYIREIAACNHNTPVEHLKRLRNDRYINNNKSVLLNPSYPANLLLEDKILTKEQVYNANYSDEYLLEKLNNKKSDLTTDIQQEIRWALLLRNQKKKSLKM